MNKYLKKHNKTKILSVIIIIISCIIIMGSTFVWFTDQNYNRNNLAFSKVKINAGDSQEMSLTINNVVPGSSIINYPLKVSKDFSSEDIYLRVKISFTSDSDDAGMQSYVNKLNQATKEDLNITGDMWSDKKGNYIYLVNESGDLLKLSDTTEYVLTNNIRIPGTLEQLENYYQYMKKIQMNIEWQAIQSTNVEGSFENIVKIFNELFPLAEEEMYRVVMKFQSNDDYNQSISEVINAGTEILFGYKAFNNQNGLVGWNESSDGLGRMYYVGERITPSNDLTLFAIWGHKLTLNEQNASCEVLDSTGRILKDGYGILDGDTITITANSSFEDFELSVGGAGFVSGSTMVVRAPLVISIVAYICEIGTQKFASLQEAVVSVTSGVDTTITFLNGIDDNPCTIVGSGVTIDSDKNITIDFKGSTYNINDAVGSPETRVNGFMCLKGSNVTLKNGKIVATSENVRMLIQNYSTSLTLEDMVLDGMSTSSVLYVLSNNNGQVTIKGNTQILAPEGNVAFDVYYGLSGYYIDGVSVTFDESFTGKIVGKIEYSCSMAENENWVELARLEIHGGVFESELSVSDYAGEPVDNANIVITAGTFTFDPTPYVDTAMCDIYCSDGYYVVNDKDAVFELNGVRYKTLSSAIEATRDGDTITLLRGEENTSRVISGQEIQIASGKNITIDFNGNTYSIDDPLVGSTGTVTTGVLIFKGSSVTFKNGVLTSTLNSVMMLVQNYSDSLIMQDMILDGTASITNIKYVLSNNNGQVTIKGNTQILAPEGNVAFDVYYGLSGYYIDGVSVTFDESFTGKIVGKIEYSCSMAENENWVELARLEIHGGVFQSELSVLDDMGEPVDNANIVITAGTFTFDPTTYVAQGANVQFADGVYIVS